MESCPHSGESLRGLSLGQELSTHAAPKVASYVFGFNVTVTICATQSPRDTLKEAAHGHAGEEKQGAKD